MLGFLHIRIKIIIDLQSSALDIVGNLAGGVDSMETDDADTFMHGRSM